MAETMDQLDRRILFELDCNSRRSLSELSRKVRLGRDLVTYRIERLESAGILKKCTAMINPYKLGLTVYKTYLKLEANKERLSEFVSYLDKHPRTSWLAETYGKWDLVWCVLARSPQEVYDLQDRLFSDFRDLIVGFNVCTSRMPRPRSGPWMQKDRYLCKTLAVVGPGILATTNRSIRPRAT